jgi:hypothetical protein
MDPAFFDFLNVVGWLLRAIGAAVFGLGAGWLTLTAFRWEGGQWELRTAAFLGLLASFVLVGNWVDGGATLGAYGLGAGVGLIIWGISGRSKETAAEETQIKAGRKSG